MVDDLLATGGTAEAGIKLIERLGGEIVGCAFVVTCRNWAAARSLRTWAWMCMCSANSRGFKPLMNLPLRP